MFFKRQTPAPAAPVARRPGPTPLTEAQMRQVVGGSPKGTWLESSPKGTWLESSPKGTW